MRLTVSPDAIWGVDPVVFDPTAYGELHRKSSLWRGRSDLEHIEITLKKQHVARDVKGIFSAILAVKHIGYQRVMRVNYSESLINR